MCGKNRKEQVLKKKIRTTSFWLGLCGAIVIVLETLSNVLGLNLHSKEVESVILSICSALVMLGIITKKNENDENNNSSQDLLDEINKDKKD